MFYVDPDRALETFLSVYMSGPALKDAHKPIRWSQRAVQDGSFQELWDFESKEEARESALEELRKLSIRPEWWARLYAAEVMRRHPELRRADLVTGLRSDKHPLVREAIDAPPPDEVEKAEREGQTAPKQPST